MGHRLHAAAVCFLFFACSAAPDSRDGREEEVAEVSQATTCGVALSKYPVAGKHNNGYDPSAGNSSLWSCDDGGSNSDYVGGDHLGNDIWAAEGTPVVATVDGTLLLVGFSNYSGNKVTIKDKCGWYHFYCHLKEIAPGISNGVNVKAGQVLGSVGKTGTASNGVVHLHYSIYPDGNYDAGVDPWPYLHAVEHAVCDGGIDTQPDAQGNVAAWGPNRLDYFARGTDGTLMHQYWTGSSWGALESLGGELTSDPVVSAWGPNRLDVFARGKDDDLVHMYWNGSTWGEWESLGGSITSNPAVVSWGPDRLDIFARGTDNDLVHLWWGGSNWGEWESLGGTLTSSPVAIAWGPNRLDIFARGEDNGLIHKAWIGNTWGDWDLLGGELTSAPAAVAWGPNRLDIFARGPENDLLHMWWGGSNWGAWESLGGNITSDPAVAAWGPNRLDIFARGEAGDLAHMWWNGSAWGTWESLGGALQSDPSVVAWGPNRLDIFNRGVGDTVEHLAWIPGWGSYESLGSPIACSGDPAAVIDFCPAAGTGGNSGTGGSASGGTGWSDGGTSTGGNGGGPNLAPNTSGDDGGCNASSRPAPGGWLALLLALGFVARSRKKRS
jgi:MYXO-CTERM domain-containing protein